MTRDGSRSAGSAGSVLTREGSGGGRFLFVVPGLPGHVNPTLAVGHELMARGHSVAWASHRHFGAKLVDPSDEFIAIGERVPTEILEYVRQNRFQGLKGFMDKWVEVFLAANRQVLPGIHAAVESFQPDIVLVDKEGFAGAIVAELRGVPWVTMGTNSADLVYWGFASADGKGDKLKEWRDRLLQELVIEAGLDPERAATFDPRFSPHLVILLTTREFVGLDRDYPEHYAFVGPTIGKRVGGGDTSFDWGWLDRGEGPCVLVSMGTINWRRGKRFFEVAAEAFRGMDARAIMVVSPDDPDDPAAAEVVPDAPPNVLVTEWVPQLDLLPHMDAVVSHGGHNTVCETLTCGLPLVISPITDDQPMNAALVARAGAGIRVKHARLKPEMLRDAVEKVLHDPSYREAAKRLAVSFEAAGGAPVAADRLEDVLARIARSTSARSTERG